MVFLKNVNDMLILSNVGQCEYEIITLKCVRYSSLVTNLSQNEQDEMAAGAIEEIPCSLNSSDINSGSWCGKWRLGTASLDR